jgi:hypothetical protein
MVECAQAKSLANCVYSQVCLESYCLDAWYQGFDDVMRRAWLWNLVLNCTSALGQNCKHCIDAFGSGALNFGQVNRLHESWICGQEGGVKGSSGGRYDLARRTFSNIFTDLSIHKSKFNISHWFVTEWSFSGAPPESLDNTGFGSID